MSQKPTYEELELRIKTLEQQAVSGINTINVSDINMEWEVEQGRCTFENLPVAMMWIDTTLAGLMSGVQAMVGTERFGLALQSEGRKSVVQDWQVISKFSEFKDGFKAIANIAAVAGWGDWTLISLDENKKECQFRVKGSWEGLYQKSIGVCWGSGMLAGKMAGYCSKLFKTNCWAEQTSFIARGEEFDEFLVKPSKRSIEKEIDNLLATDESTRADMAVALQKLQKEISERRQIEEKLRESKELYRLLADNVTDVIWIRDMNLNLTYISPSVFEQQGLTVDEAMARSPQESWTPDSFKRNMEILKEELEIEKKKQKDMTRSRTVETEVRCKDGSTIWTEAKISFLRNPNGEPTGIIGVTRDITERKQMEEALQHSEERYRSLVENTIYGFFIHEIPSGRFLFLNQRACELYGYTMQEGLELTVWDVLSSEDHERIKNRIQARVKGKRLGRDIQTYTAVRKDGSTFRLEVSSSLIIFQDRSAVQGIFRDVTEQEHLEHQLREAHKMEAIGTLAGGIAHDFNNILSSILGYTELALDDVEKETSLEDSLQEIYTAGKRARDLVKQILAFARRSEEERKPIRVDHIAKEALKLIRSAIPVTIEIRQQFESQSLIMGNASQMNQFFMNLFTNAAHAMEDTGGILEVSLKDVIIDLSFTKSDIELEPGNYVKIRVSDTGKGIPQDIMNSIFEPYFTTKAPGEGTGMGLAMVHGIIESYGGRITVESKIGEGTVFTIYLPITKKRYFYQTYKDEDLPHGTERVLLIDDELPIVRMQSRILEGLGYHTSVRTSSVETLELFRIKPNDFDLVITDMTMPNMTGDHLAVELMKIRPDIPIILCTGYSKMISEEKAEKIGIKAFVYKPIIKADLAKTVRKILDESKAKS
jgi:PAS domain S-box-containing protein